MSVLTSPLSVATHSFVIGTSCGATFTTSTSSGGAAAPSTFFSLHPLYTMGSVTINKKSPALVGAAAGRLLTAFFFNSGLIRNTGDLLFWASSAALQVGGDMDG